LCSHLSLWAACISRIQLSYQKFIMTALSCCLHIMFNVVRYSFFSPLF